MLVEPGLNGAPLVVRLTETADRHEHDAVAEFLAHLPCELEAVDSRKPEVDERQIGIRKRGTAKLEFSP